MPARLERVPLAWAVFAVAALASATLILIISRGATFGGDEWGMVFRLVHDPLPSALFKPPPGKYLIAVPTLIYGGLAELFGTGSYLPYRVLGVVLVVAAAGLFLALAKRRVALWLALPCSILLLFLGAAWEVVAIPGRVPSQIAICAGLAMLLLLDRRDRAGDIGACGLATLAVISHPIGLAFVVAAAVIVPFGRRRGWTRSWVFLVPLAVYGLWSVTLRETPQDAIPVTLHDSLSFAWQSFIAVCATVTGIFRPPWTRTVDFSTVASHALAFVAIGACLVAIARARRVSVWLIAALAALAFNLVAPSLAPGGLAFGFRNPQAPRYLYPGTVLLLWVVVEAVALRRVSFRAAVAGGAVVATVFAVAMVSNVVQLVKSAHTYDRVSGVVNAELGVFNLTRDGRSPSELASEQDKTLEESSGYLAFMFILSNAAGVDSVATAAPAYYLVSDRYGGPADSSSAIRAAPLAARQQADRLLISTLPVHLRPVTGAVPRAATAGSSSGSVGDRCRRFEPAGAGEGTSKGSISLSGPPGRVWVVEGTAGQPSVTLGRLSGEPVQAVGWPSQAPRTASMRLPAAGLAATPWRLAVIGAAEVTYCPDRELSPQ
jgi:hypothetical protein